MSCEVSINDIIKEIKHELLDPRFVLYTAKPTDGGLAVLFLGANEAQVEDTLSEINNKYASNLYGTVVSYIPLGVSKDYVGYDYKILIHPTQGLADAMTYQNYQDEQTENYSRREQELSRITEGLGSTKDRTRFQNISNYLRKNSVQKESNESNADETRTIKEIQEDLILDLTDKNPKWVISGTVFENKEVYDEGAESRVFLDLKKNRVIKINSNTTYNSWTELLDAISIHNELFPETAYQFMGFTDYEGRLGLVLSQPFINEEELTSNNEEVFNSLFNDDVNTSYDLIYSKLDDHMLSKGFERTGALGSYYNRELGVVIQDLNPYNFFSIGDNIFVIDSDIRILDQSKPNTSSENFSPREQQVNSKRPITDNFVEYKRYKETQLSKVKNILKSLQKDKRNPNKDLSTVMADINKYAAIEAKLKNDIESLNKNETDLMFGALTIEIAELDSALDNATDVENIKDRLDFLYRLVKGESMDNKVSSGIESLSGYNHPDFDKISSSLDRLNRKYKEKLSALTNEIIKTDISYANNVLNNDKITPEQLKEMFHSPNDINWMEKTFLGITSSSNNDTIIPQILKSFLETKVAVREAEAKVLQDRLTALVHKLSSKGFDFIFEKTDGVKTGNIINVISPKFGKMVSRYLAIDRDENKDSGVKYKEKVQWLKNNTEVIDFRRLKSVKELYGSLYPEYFTAYNDADAENYEKFLQDTLGPLYEEEISKVFNSLENFQMQKDALLSDAANSYRFRNVARIDPWAFIKNYNSPNFENQIAYNAGGVNTEEVYSDVQNIRFIPIKETFVTYNEYGDEVYKSSGYYNEDFNEILSDPDKLEYWRLMREIYSDYINPTYGNEYSSDLSYAKFEDSWIEAISNSKGLLKGTEAFKQATKGFKSFFYERGEYRESTDRVAKNYRDNAVREITELAKTLEQLSPTRLQEELVKESLGSIKGTTKEKARTLARKKILDKYSTDINKTTAALLEMTTLQKAREDVLPVARVLLDSHKLASMDENGNDTRKRSVERMENWINRVIVGENEKYRGGTSFLGKNLTKNSLFGTILDKVGSIPLIGKLINKRKAMFFSDSEKELLKYLDELKQNGHNKESDGQFSVGGVKYFLQQTEDGPKYFQYTDKLVPTTENIYEKAFQSHIEERITNIGLDLNAAGIIQGILKTIILKGLGLNPISGIFNRIEGKNSGLIMDQTGQYWTKGNIHKANNFMQFVNFTKFLPERFTPEQNRKIQEFKKLQILVHNMNLIQDRKNELERQNDKSKFDYIEKLNIYQWAVENPEFKNQGAILLSVLMDAKIKDISGNEVSLFDGKGFPAYDNQDGKLVLKEEFRTPENISNWENFAIDEKEISNNQYFVTKQKIKNAISRSQGNYDNLDVINATKDIWGRALTLFMKWMPEHFMQRFSSGKGIDLATGKNKIKGRYRYLWENNPALITTGVASLFIGFGLTPFTALAGLGLTGAVVAKYLKNVYSKEAIHQETLSAMEFVAFAKSAVISTLNYPLEFFNSNKLISQDFGDNVVPGYSKTNLSQEEIDNLRAIAKELAVKLTFLSIMLLAKKLTWDDDDDKDSDRRQLHNFLDNQMSRMISSLSNWTNPEALATDAQRMAFLKYLWDVGKLLTSVAKFNEKGDLGENLFKVSPLPRMLTKKTSPWHDEREYETAQWQDRFIKDANSGGEWTNKKKYEKMRKEKKEEFKDNFKSQGLEGDALSDAVDNAMSLEFPRRKEGESYLSIVTRIESGEKGKAPKKRKKSSKSLE